MQSNIESRVVTETRDRVAYVTMDRPEAKNALTKSMYAAIRQACAAADRDPNVDVLVLKGSGGAFAVGGDLKEMLDILGSDNPLSIMDYEEYLPFEAVRSMTKPTVAAIDGLCLGGGLTLALMCDILITTDRSRFAIPEAKVGIVDGHLPRLLRDRVPAARLRYWMYTGALFSALEAYEVGLVTRVVPAAQLEDSVQHCLRELKASSLEAIQALKRIQNETRTLSPMTDAYLSLLQPVVLERLRRFGKK